MITAQVQFTDRVEAVAELERARYQNRGWTLSSAVGQVSGPESSVTVSLTAPTSLTWHWAATDYRLMTVVAGEGRVSLSNQWFTVGSKISIAAIPDDGVKFLAWEGAPPGSETTNPLTLTMDAPYSLTALFVRTGDPSLVSEWQTLG